MIKAVIFDYGNVISLPPGREIYEKMGKISGLDADIFIDAFPVSRKEFDLGLIDGKRLYHDILLHAGRRDLAENDKLCEELALVDIHNWVACDPLSTQWAIELKKDYKLGVLSNMPEDFLYYHENDIEVFAAAHNCVFSCRVGLIKPDEKIYRIALDNLGVKAEEAVFFDDLPKNIEAANKLGIHGVIWENVHQAKREFQKILEKTGSN